ncbi:MAG: hypothetical protein ACYTG2_13060 [Planctomycetota bacterium]
MTQEREASRRLLLPALLALALAPGLRAQVPDLVVSLTSDDALPGGTVLDQELVFHAPGATAHVAWPTATLALLAGDADGAQLLHTILNDVDAVHLSSGGPTAADALYVSMPVDQAGFKDGDVLRFGPSGLEAYFEETDFVLITGASDGNIDVDAFHEEPDGTIVFSFADNEDSLALSGDDPGVIKDGDVLSWNPSDPLATILYTESEISAMVSAALGASTSTTDTTGLARNPASGEMLFSVLSPTPEDASVFTTANGGARLAGHEEASFGFTGSPELDGLSVATWRFPSLTASNMLPAAGESVTFKLSDAEPNRPYVVLAALSNGTIGLPSAGWGGFVLHQDPLLVMTWSSASAFLVVPDGAGQGELDTTVPSGLSAIDVVVQAVAPGALPDVSNPMVLELLQ